MVAGTAEGNPMEATCDGLRFPHGGLFASEDQESRLKGVFRVGPAGQGVPTDIEDESTVPTHQHSKRGFIAALNEAAQQVGIRLVLGVLRHEHAAQVPKKEIELNVRHDDIQCGEDKLFF